MPKQKEISFEEELAKLEAIIEELERGEVPLATLVERYSTGIAHLKKCQEKLAEAELRIEQLKNVDAAGTPESAPFEEGDI